MTQNKSNPPTGLQRGAPVRARILDAAEHLMRQGKADFSMRDLASEAGVSFATPFNHFGSKAGIMQALSGRRIDAMEARYRAASPPGDAAARVGAAVDIAAAVMLEEPLVSRGVMGWLGTPAPDPGLVAARSAALWALALDDGDGLNAARRSEALTELPQQLAFAFRGVLSFWTAGELADAALAPQARALATTLLCSYGG
ncbi:AcrR family transcriptional regulator [Sphingobium sp. B1D7B]|jgi:AcrR family transcriptional regulator|uniref:TetR/AcrR family transcriptional regulator n=1 Tax=Sphingobium sp. B1D7B TaxID=2940578 RepID=UPI00105E485A|nr:TetR/AcrR family transcriptional regulator [Sphingobium sp. B1D7B]MCW2406106.1 AcrR family transcriptional regulator [Sphingobium sp. B1D7B]